LGAVGAAEGLSVTDQTKVERPFCSHCGGVCGRVEVVEKRERWLRYIWRCWVWRAMRSGGLGMTGPNGGVTTDRQKEQEQEPEPEQLYGP
jgi:hypothetical protein